MEEEPTPVIPGYQGLELIGTGMTATVWRAHHEEFDRDVAIKVLKPGFERGEARDRFEREKRISARLGNHPHVVTVYATGTTTDGRPFLSMELCPRGSLADQLDRYGAFTIDEVLDVGVKIADAVHAAHSKDVLHRDIKPQNIMQSEYGPALTDFGIARSTGGEMTATVQHLTPVHSAPEAFLDADPTPQMDVYSLGSTLYTLLAGLPAFPRRPNETYTQYLLRLERDPLPAFRRRDVPPELREVIETAMAKDPDDRFATAQEFRNALARIGTATGTDPTRAPGDDTTQPEPAPAPTLEAPTAADPLAGAAATVEPAPPHTPSGTETVIRPPVTPLTGTDREPPPPGVETVIRPVTDPTAPEAGAPSTADTRPRTGRGRRIAVVAIAAGVALLVLVAVVTIINPGSKATSGTAEVVGGLNVDPSLNPTDLSLSAPANAPWKLSWSNNAGTGAQFIVQYRPVGSTRWTVAGTTDTTSFTGTPNGSDRRCYGVTAVVDRTTQSGTATICQ